MTLYTALKRLHARRAQWTRERFHSDVTQTPDFLNGVLCGLAEAIAMVKECHDQAMKNPRRR
jgi:hypothetical protein